MKDLNYIDLFAGTSALSEGFKQMKFNPVAYIERDAEACLTIKTRVAYHYLKENKKIEIYYDYISGNISREELYRKIPSNIQNIVIKSEITETTLKNIFKKIENDLVKNYNSEIDLILGGPPCQAYSIIGRHSIDWEKDHRLRMYIYYGQFLKHFRPKAFVFENVPGMLTAEGGEFFKNVKNYFINIGYEVHDKILNAADYGVLQNRKRVIIVGWRKDIKLHFPEPEKITHNFNINDIISDLTPLEPGESVIKEKYKKKLSEYLIKFNLINDAGFYIQHISRKHNSNDLKIYKLAIEKWEKERKRLRYTDIPEELRTHKNTSSFLDRFKVIDKNGLSHTIVAHIAKDGHYYIHPEIKQCRSISVREAARIQSFPDDFYFEGPRTSVFRQIGNAVPPLLSLALAKSIKKQFTNL